jgi:hypothetical protein
MIHLHLLASHLTSLEMRELTGEMSPQAAIAVAIFVVGYLCYGAGQSINR